MEQIAYNISVLALVIAINGFAIVISILTIAYRIRRKVG